MEGFFRSVRAARIPCALQDFQSRGLAPQANKSQITAVSCDTNGSCICKCFLSRAC